MFWIIKKAERCAEVGIRGIDEVGHKGRDGEVIFMADAGVLIISDVLFNFLIEDLKASYNTFLAFVPKTCFLAMQS